MHLPFSCLIRKRSVYIQTSIVGDVCNFAHCIYFGEFSYIKTYNSKIYIIHSQKMYNFYETGIFLVTYILSTCTSKFTFLPRCIPIRRGKCMRDFISDWQNHSLFVKMDKFLTKIDDQNFDFNFSHFLFLISKKATFMARYMSKVKFR